MLYNKIYEINTSKTNWALRVRLVRAYRIPTYSNKNVTSSLECVFHDSEYDRIHATIRRERVPEFEESIKEGEAYSLRNFIVTPNDMRYKTTSCAYKILFNKKTTLVEYEGKDIPKAMFDFRPYTQLRNPNSVDESELFDIMGSVKSIHFPRPHEFNGECQKLTELVLEDPLQRVLKCTLWGCFVDAIKKGVEKHPNFMIAVVKFCRAKVYRGEVGVTNSFYASQLILNGKDNEILEYKDKFDFHGDDGYTGDPIKVTTYEEEEGDSSGNDTVNISSLYDKSLVGRYSIAGEIIDVETSDGWWYWAWKECARKVTPKCGRFDCLNPTCKNSDGPVMRFKVKIRIMDSTANAAFILWDNACQEMFGKKAADFVAQMKNKEDEAPNEIKNLIEKRVICLVQVQNEKSKKGENAFSIVKLKEMDDSDQSTSGESSGVQDSNKICDLTKEYQCDEEGKDCDEVDLNSTSDKVTGFKRAVIEIGEEGPTVADKKGKKVVQVKVEKN